MGLDQYAYVAARANAHNDYYEAEYGDDDTKKGTTAKPREIAYWRKHPHLQGWMENLWLEKLAAQGTTPQQSQYGSSFNGIELELTWEDLDRLEQAIKQKQLPLTRGFFFGEDSDQYYRKQDLEFVKNARAELFLGLKVFYNSSW